MQENVQIQKNACIDSQFKKFQEKKVYLHMEEKEFYLKNLKIKQG